MKVKILNDNNTYDVKDGTTLLELCKCDKKYYAAKVNKRFHELRYNLASDCEVEFLDLNDASVTRIYEAGIRFIFSMAFYNLYPNASLSFNYNVSRSILGICKGLDKKFSQEDLDKLENEVKKIIEKDYPIIRKLLNIDEITKIYKKENLNSKNELLNYHNEEYINVYECNGFYNYMYSNMVPSTGYLKEFKTFLYGPGFIIQYPRAEAGGKIPEFNDSKAFSKALRDAAVWNKITNANTISLMNSCSIDQRLKKDLINICEVRHTNDLYTLCKKIYDKKDDIKLIAIAGPSSSGKTTFSERLKLTLRSLGLNPIRISIDDYYLPKDKIPTEEDGSKDLENINALDIERFNRDMKDLINGKKVTLPKYNFKKAIIEDGETIKLEKGSQVIIEGIHALNEILTSQIARKNKFNIYISPQTQLHIDDQNPISITDLRLLRRIVRDAKYRNSKAEETISMWPSVRKGEFKWIYPFQDSADFVFSTELAYEFMVLKKHALPNLQAVPRDSEFFAVANRLLKFLKYFLEIEDFLVPCNSLLREFIGGSCVC